MAWQGRRGMDGKVRRGAVGRVLARLDSAWQACFGRAGQGEVRQGAVCIGKLWQAWKERRDR